MTSSSLDRFIAHVQREWRAIDRPLVASCREHLAQLTLADPAEPWLAALHAGHPAAKELHRDADHGFMLLAHAEHSGLCRPPHDHGRAWVVYGVQSGALEVTTYARIAEGEGRRRLIERDTEMLRPGMARAYWPGDIHATSCLDDAIVLRFTERDLRREDQIERRVARFVRLDGEWTLPGA